MESAPETSPFFGKDDELWDLKGVSGYDAPSITSSTDWIIWNQTTGRLVAKADWAGLSKIHTALEPNLLTLARGLITLELLEADNTGGPPADGAKLLGKVEFSTPTGNRTSGKWSGGGTALEYDAEPIFDSEGFIISLKLDVTARAPGHDQFRVATELLLVPGEPVWAARDTDGRKGLDLKVSSRVVLSDGTPVEERCLIQKNGRTVRLQKKELTEEEQAVENKGWLAIMYLPPDTFTSEGIFGGGHQGDGGLSAESKEKKEPALLEMPSTEPPTLLHPWLDHEVLDLKSLLKELMPFIRDDEDFLGYDPITRKLYLYSQDKEAVGKMGSLFMGLDDRIRAMVAITFEGNGTSRLLGKLASRPSMVRKNEGKKQKRMLEVESLVDDGLIGLRSCYDDKSDPGKVIHVNNSAKLETGIPQVLLTGTSGEGGTSSLRVTGEVIPVDLE